MIKKRICGAPQDFIRIGMAFFLMSIFVSMLADSQIIGTYLTHAIPNNGIVAAIQGGAAGFSIPISCASIYFNIRGLFMLRSRSSPKLADE